MDPEDFFRNLKLEDWQTRLLLRAIKENTPAPYEIDEELDSEDVAQILSHR